MTCIVGVEHGGRVYIGGDSAGSGGGSITIRADQKVFTVGDYVMGFTSSFRMGQLLRYAFKPPMPDGDLDAFMVTRFIDATRECLSEGGWLETKNEREDAGTFLVGIRGRLYSVHDDLQVGRSVDGYDAVGSGAAVALGSLHTTVGRRPQARIEKALAASAYFNTGVAGPFITLVEPGRR